jgi:hypothetical protein
LGVPAARRSRQPELDVGRLVQGHRVAARQDAVRVVDLLQVPDHAAGAVRAEHAVVAGVGDQEVEAERRRTTEGRAIDLRSST